ncbi:MAG: hypothetical protein AB7S26_00870 [Sandaracinaceae bacterium]
MALIKTRPKLRVRAPAKADPGGELHVQIALDCKRAVDVEFVDIDFYGIESYYVNRLAQQQRFGHVRARICGERALPAGTTPLACRVPVDIDAPPTYAGRFARMSYVLDVHCSIARWPDRRGSFELRVGSRPQSPLASATRIFSSDPDGPRGREPHAELSLAELYVRPGGVISGAFALSNTGYQTYTVANVALVAREQLYLGGRPYQSIESVRYKLEIDISKAHEGEMIPFRVRLPNDLPPEIAFAPRPGGLGGLFTLVYHFELQIGVRWSEDLTLRVPFRVLPAEGGGDAAELKPVPAMVGSDRLRSVWESVGKPRGMRYDTGRLSTDIGGTSLSISREHRGKEGVFLTLELDYPSLHLDLEVHPSSAVDRTFRRGVLTGIDAWDRDHMVNGRDAEQCALVLRRLIPSLEGAILRRMDDTRAVVATRDAGSNAEMLTRFADASLRLARAVEELRGSVPPPSRLTGVVDTWRALAAKLGGSLETARMRIEGELLGHEVMVEPAFDEQGHAVSTVIELRALAPFEDAQRIVLDIGIADPVAAIAATFGPEPAALVRGVAHGAVHLSIEGEVIRVGLPAPIGLAYDARNDVRIRTRADAPRDLETAESVEARVGLMVQLAQLLRGSAGPYR